MFHDVVTMNEAFGNPKGQPGEISQPRFLSQCRNIADEVAELQQAIEEKNPIKIRDALSDIMVFTLGAYHFLGVDADADMAAVFKSNMSKFCKDEQELSATKAKYDALGVKHYEEGEFPTKCLKCLEDFTDAAGNAYRKGKFLKGIAYQEPVLPEL
jgi:NTP pyrophosphatase (non-canonical NTP hydrolase)